MIENYSDQGVNPNIIMEKKTKMLKGIFDMSKLEFKLWVLTRTGASRHKKYVVFDRDSIAVNLSCEEWINKMRPLKNKVTYKNNFPKLVGAESSYLIMGKISFNNNNNFRGEIEFVRKIVKNKQEDFILVQYYNGRGIQTEKIVEIISDWNEGIEQVVDTIQDYVGVVACAE